MARWRTSPWGRRKQLWAMPRCIAHPKAGPLCFPSCLNLLQVAVYPQVEEYSAMCLPMNTWLYQGLLEHAKATSRTLKGMLGLPKQNWTSVELWRLIKGSASLDYTWPFLLQKEHKWPWMLAPNIYVTAGKQNYLLALDLDTTTRTSGLINCVLQSSVIVFMMPHKYNTIG